MNTEDPLRDCLLEARSNGIEMARIVGFAGVSTKTLASVLQGKYYTKMLAEVSKKSKPDHRKIRGLLGSMTRLAEYFKLDPQTVADTYGFPRNAYYSNVMRLATIHAPNSKENKAEAVQFDRLLDRPLTQEDINFLGGVIEKVGGPIPISAALSLLSSRDNVRHAPS